MINLSWWSRTTDDGAPIYSDHQPLIGHHVLSWNILEKCRRGKDRTNNGYGYNETDEQYKTRLKRIAYKVAEIIEKHNIDVVHLQEAPVLDEYFVYFRDCLREKLGDTFYIGINFLHQIGPNSGCFTMFNKNKYIGSNVTAFHEKNLGAQKGRVLFSHLKDRNTHESFVVANGHFASRTDPKQAIQYFDEQRISFAADLNVPAKDALMSCTSLYSNCEGHNFSFNVKDNKPFRTTQYDAISIYSACLLKNDVILENEAAECTSHDDYVAPDMRGLSSVDAIMRRAKLDPNALALKMYTEAMQTAGLNVEEMSSSIGSSIQPFYQSYSGSAPPPSLYYQDSYIRYPSVAHSHQADDLTVSRRDWRQLMRRNLLNKSADEFLTFTPANDSSMAEFRFMSKDAAELFLGFLIKHKIITNTKKKIYHNTGSVNISYFSLPLGVSELDRLNQLCDTEEEQLKPRKRVRYKY